MKNCLFYYINQIQLSQIAMISNHNTRRQSKYPHPTFEQFVPAPNQKMYRNTIQVQKVNSPTSYNLYVDHNKRSSYNPAYYYPDAGNLQYPIVVSDGLPHNQSYAYCNTPILQAALAGGQNRSLNLQENKKKSYTKPKQFITSDPTPRMTASKNQQSQYINHPNYGYIIINPNNPQKFQPVYQYFDEPEVDNDDNEPQEIVSVLSKDNQQSISSKGERLIGNDRIMEKGYNDNKKKAKRPNASLQSDSINNNYVNQKPRNTFEHEKSNKPMPINYVQNVKHGHKRSQVGPVASGLQAHGHRRLATTAEQYDEEYSKTQTQQQPDNPHDNEQDQKDQQNQEEYYENYGNVGQIPQVVHVNSLPQLQMPYIQKPVIIYQTPQMQMLPEPNFKKKPVVAKPKDIEKQIEARFKDIEETLQTQTQNLKQHNQYLLAVIKKLQSKDRKQKHIINTQYAQIQKLTQQKNAYLERCLHLQAMITNYSNPNEKGVQKKYSILNIGTESPDTQNIQSSTASDANNETVNFQYFDVQKLNEPRDRKKNTTPQRSHPGKFANNLHLQNHVLSSIPTTPSPNSNQPKTPTQNFSPDEIQYYVNQGTPHFSSNNQSPARKPRLTAKISNGSNNSDPESAIIHNSGILQESSFGGCFVNTNSGLSIVKTLHNQIQTPRGQNQLPTQTEISQQQQSESEKNQTDSADNQDTLKNTYKAKSQARNQSDSDVKKIQQLNFQFQELMKTYRINHDAEIRKQCVHIAKEIKQLKLEVQKNKQLKEIQSLSPTSLIKYQEKTSSDMKLHKRTSSEEHMQTTRVRGHRRLTNTQPQQRQGEGLQN